MNTLSCPCSEAGAHNVCIVATNGVIGQIESNA